ncbi:hypothetical protein CDL60_08705 [Roseateles noduli]|nr:hypothetical protein CDL60_08705 [Roseateles noduli]
MNRTKTRVGLFRWLAFNILIANDDNHLKNLSLFVSRRSIELAPHYDLIATEHFYTPAFADEGATYPHMRMTIPSDGAKTFHDTNRKIVIKVGIELRLDAPTAECIVSGVVDKFESLLDFAEKARARARAMAMARVHETMPKGAKVNAGRESTFAWWLRFIVIPTMRGKLLARGSGNDCPSFAG